MQNIASGVVPAAVIHSSATMPALLVLPCIYGCLRFLAGVLVLKLTLTSTIVCGHRNSKVSDCLARLLFMSPVGMLLITTNYRQPDAPRASSYMLYVSV